LGGSFEQIVRTSSMLLEQIGAKPVMQVANIRIPHLLNEKYGISLELLKSMHIEEIVKSGLPWIEQLVKINTVADLEDMSMFPDDLKAELEKIKHATEGVTYEPLVISPLFYAKMRYYDSLTFRMFEGNSLLATGGIYTIDGVEAAGFALYTDACILSKMNKGSK
ncbi:MAG TPA: ATP phosphoribosyltransferase regulatory subunit, partial [Epsilonproteobacteria bacterium]|nr:ATP phosphoribosyltransferase regulatory subunit [Campylobacterota bacterium]